MRIIQDIQTIQMVKQQCKVKTLIKNLIKSWWVTQIYFSACFMLLVFQIGLYSLSVNLKYDTGF